MYPRQKVYAYDFAQNYIPGEAEINRGYWRDVGTIDSFFAASLDLVAVTPLFNLYNDKWPMVSAPQNLPPAKFVFADSKSQRIGIATDSLVSDGVIISGGNIDRCVLHPRVRIHSYTDIDESILMDGVEIGRHSKIRRTIIDKGVKIPPGTTIGYDIEADRQRFTVTDSGIVVVPKGVEIAEGVVV
jgi:glucose-1-phosphate adenylyltransferase